MRPNIISQNLCVLSLILLTLWPNGSCGRGRANMMSQDQKRVATGNWGGQNVQMDVTDGGVRFRFNCASGSIEQPLTLDAEGRFNARGTFLAEGMGPRNEDDPPKSQPAIYSGSVRDGSMTLTVTVPDTRGEGGTFTLEHGKPGRIWKCH